MTDLGKVIQLRRFLAMTSYYRNFIYGFLMVLKPLTELNSKKVKFIRNARQSKAYAQLKQALCESRVFAKLDYTAPFVIYPDASSAGHPCTHALVCQVALLWISHCVSYQTVCN
eukprot:NODE_183_length_15731_cov_0.226778.p11 type:complete len:114 gc:universal NODE_183_length_15731_cov_0.226778:10313-10654(+)